MNLVEFEGLYERLVQAVERGKTGLRVPAKLRGGTPTKDAIVLCYLFSKIGEPVSKSELTAIVRHYYPDVNDVQQARHLAAQKGFWIASGTRGDATEGLKHNEYMLLSLGETYPGWKNHRVAPPKDFNALKNLYSNRCATCGSPEGKRNYLNPAVVTSIQEGHIDPRKPLAEGNAIPQCQVCNRAYRDWFIFYPNGRVRTINPNSPRWLGITDGFEEGTFGNGAQNAD